jgi:hypothetical protein
MNGWRPRLCVLRCRLPHGVQMWGNETAACRAIPGRYPEIGGCGRMPQCTDGMLAVRERRPLSDPSTWALKGAECSNTITISRQL